MKKTIDLGRDFKHKKDRVLLVIKLAYYQEGTFHALEQVKVVIELQLTKVSKA